MIHSSITCWKSCSSDLALTDLMISVRKSLQALSWLAGLCSQQGKQMWTAHNRLSSLSSWYQHSYPFCFFFSQHGVSHWWKKARFSCSVELRDFLSSNCLSHRFFMLRQLFHQSCHCQKLARRRGLPWIPISCHLTSSMDGCCGCVWMLRALLYCSPVRLCFSISATRSFPAIPLGWRTCFHIFSCWSEPRLLTFFSLHSIKTLLSSLLRTSTSWSSVLLKFLGINLQLRCRQQSFASPQLWCCGQRAMHVCKSIHSVLLFCFFGQKKSFSSVRSIFHSYFLCFSVVRLGISLFLSW